MTAAQEAMMTRCDRSCLYAASLLGRRGIAPRNILIRFASPNPIGGEGFELWRLCGLNPSDPMRLLLEKERGSGPFYAQVPLWIFGVEWASGPNGLTDCFSSFAVKLARLAF